MYFVYIENLDDALLAMAYEGDMDDKYLYKFKKSVSSVPGQIIRYFFFFFVIRQPIIIFILSIN